MSLYKLKASVTYIGILWPLEIKQLTGNRSKLLGAQFDKYGYYPLKADGAN